MSLGSWTLPHLRELWIHNIEASSHVALCGARTVLCGGGRSTCDHANWCMGICVDHLWSAYIYIYAIPSQITFDNLQILTDIIPFPQIKNDSGVILFVVLGGRPKRERYPQIDDSIWSMLVRCWDAEPIRRPSMSTLYQFFSQFS